jgi:hypothetical protein
MSQDIWNTVLDGFYREGYATYFSSMLFPGYNDEEYLFMSRELYKKCLVWMELNWEKILKDCVDPLEVLNIHHKFYFTTWHNPDYPNIGYVIGYHYVKHLNNKYSLTDLVDFGLKKEEKEREFVKYIKNAEIFARS